MNRRKYLKAGKLKRIHIWPSILGFFVYGAVVLALIVGCTVGITENVLNTKFTQKNTEVEYLAKLYDARSSSENQQDALSYLAEHSTDCSVFAVLDEHNSVLESVGNVTADLKNEIPLKTMRLNEFYYDQHENLKWISENGKLTIPFHTIMRQLTILPDQGVENWLEKSVYEVPFWGKTELENMPNSLLVKFSFVLNRRDLLYFAAMGVMFIILFVIPFILLLFSIISKIRTQHRMYQMFYYDTVTKGKNWLYFLHYSEKLLTSRWRAAKTYAIVDLQLEKYRSFCSCYGVHEGEYLLETMNQTINQIIDKRELCVRYAKSNFALLLACNTEEECKARMESMIQEVAVLKEQKHLSFHSGIYMIYPTLKNDTGHICRRINVDIPQSYTYASEARASIEENEENAVAVFDQNMIDDQLWVNWVENHMEQAMANEEFVVYLQPKYNPINDQLVGAEALVRWISPEKGFITPNRFIPIFEDNGFIIKLDDYMVLHIAKLQAQWIRQGRTVVPISVNISRVHFTTENLAEHLCNLVDTYETPHEVIEIELTESAFFDDKKVLLNTVRQLKEAGFELSMDDFGAGYSSLNTLKDLPLDVLKIDAEFFRGKDEEKRGDIIVGETIKLAKNLSMRTVAEGIETKEQVEFLADKGCDMIQGFYYAKPMPVKEYEQKYGVTALLGLKDSLV